MGQYCQAFFIVSNTKMKAAKNIQVKNGYELRQIIQKPAEKLVVVKFKACYSPLAKARQFEAQRKRAQLSSPQHVWILA